MDEEKRKKILKILGWCAFILAVVAIVTMSIVSSVLKDKTANTEKDNQQIEEVLNAPQESE